MRSKLTILVATVATCLALQGCSGDPPKTGQPIQKGDYMFAPGGGAKPGAAPAAPAPN